MKTLEEVRNLLRRHKQRIEEEFGVVVVGVFGSYAREEQSSLSDLDILVELKKPIGFKFFELWDKLEEITGVKVDLLTVEATKQKPLLWKSIKEDLVRV
jgi:predicted nucleotidyltransferase